jgi:hypothetical protein
MADWTNLPNTAVGVGGLPSGTTVTALRDNPVAIAEGAPGAPRVLPSPAIDWNSSTGTIAERNWVLARTGQAAAGAVGTYVFAGTRTNSSDDKNFGDTISGGNLRPVGIQSPDSFTTTTLLSAAAYVSQTGTPLSGTWRCMGRNRALTTVASATLWLRIS